MKRSNNLLERPHLKIPCLKRQNASKFSWPPDPVQSWTYISMSPDKISSFALKLLNITVSTEMVIEFFKTHNEKPYLEYASKWNINSSDILR